MVTERLVVEGQLLNDNALAKMFALLEQLQIAFSVKKFRVGEFSTDPSLIELIMTAPDWMSMERAVRALVPYGAVASNEDATVSAADVDGVLPEGFYSTTNFTTFVRHQGQWIPVEKLEMDCGIRLCETAEGWRAETCPMHKVKVGDLLVVGPGGVKVVPMESEELDADEFRFMANEISVERPKSRLIAHCAAAIRRAREEGRGVLLVGGPAIIHSGSGPALESLILNGWVTVLFAGNALAAHDIEAAMLGTSLGVDLEVGHGVPHGHTNHLRAINRVRRAGSIEAAVSQGIIGKGVMYTCVKTGTPYVLCGSIRDDGPLPDVVTDNVEAQDIMRRHIGGLAVAVMIATTLHSVATGNILPASVKTYCVDSDADSVIKLTDRGTHQAIGLVTDCEFFLKELVRLLA